MDYTKRAQQRIENRKPNTDFNLLDMGVIFDQVDGAIDVPHRHDYYTVLLIGKASGEHLIDYQSFPFQPQEVHFVGPGQVHQVAATAKPTGWVFTFSRDFLVENNIPESFITNINLFRTFGHSPPLALDQATFDRLFSIIQQMHECLPLNLTYRNRALGALLQLFLIHCNNSAAVDPSQLDEDNSGVCILRDFKHLVDDHYAKWHKVNEYAAEIHLSPKYLSQTVKQFTGKSAKEFIQDRLVLEAKRLLLHTELSVKEIAYRIGFEEPLHFSGFFKKKAGISPSHFRETK
ncbi:MAG: helix-turn-helix transcriptional regulator [Bacteroidota bacterium]